MVAEFDIAVIGGGIHGASVAEAAAAQGHSVVLLEQVRPAYGTSSRSSKLIHGGLRYLEGGQFKLVAECLKERAILLRRAPELVNLQPFLIPIYRHSQRRSWQIRAGLSIYCALGGFTAATQFSCLSPTDWDTLDGLSTHNLRQVYRYFDAQTDDAALTRAVLRSAQELGARIEYPARFLDARRADGRWRVGFEHAGGEHSLSARVLINAAGPWVNQVLTQIEGAPAPLPLDWVQGTHIVLDGTLRQGIYYVEAEDRRAVFVMPWQGQVLIGTTEKIFTGHPDQAAPTEEEIAYLRRTAEQYFPWLGQARLIDAFAGLRVLPRTIGAPFSRPRETVFLSNDRRQPTLLSIYGGKLTAARATAEQVLLRVNSQLPRATPQADTRQRRLKPA